MIGRRSLARPTPLGRGTALGATLALACVLSVGPGSARVRAADEAVEASQRAPELTTATRRPFPTRDEAAAGTRRGGDRPDGANASTGSWWLGTAGIAVALAACGWLSLASRRWKPSGVAGVAGLRVVGRTSLSPRHAVYLLQAGDRVLLVGTGPQGAPSLLGELPAAVADRPTRPRVDLAHDDPAATAGSHRFDLRLGDEE